MPKKSGSDSPLGGVDFETLKFQGPNPSRKPGTGNRNWKQDTNTGNREPETGIRNRLRKLETETGNGKRKTEIGAGAGNGKRKTENRNPSFFFFENT